MASARYGGLGRHMRDRAPGTYRLVAPWARAVKRASSVAFDVAVATGARAVSGHRSALGSSADPRVILDGCVFQEHFGGIARVWTALMKEWSHSGFARNVVVLDRGRTSPKVPGFTYIDLPRVRAYDTGAQRRLIEAICSRERADLYVSTLYTRPVTSRSLLCVLDFTPEVLGWDLSTPLWRDKRNAIAHASAYICISQNTAHDLHRLYPESTARPWDVALLGVDLTFRVSTSEEIEMLRARFDLPANYYMFLGHRDDYKNADLLFSALSRFGETPGFGVLLVGGAPELEPQFADAAHRIPVRIAHLGDDDLRAAFSGARALLYLSRHEGFGLPILEAMACGCPVISTMNSSLPEASGDVAVAVADANAEQVADAMQRVLEPEIRSDLIARGLAWSSTFTWERTASAFQGAIERAARADRDGSGNA